MISKSPQRYSFQRENYIKDKDPTDLEDDPYLDFLTSFKAEAEKRTMTAEWKIDNLEYDLRTTQWILDKVRASNSYAQNLYASMCNNDFIKNDVWPILTDKKWHCSWRYAGGIIADMQEKGDYIDWYCSGIRSNEDMADDPDNVRTPEGQALYEEIKKYVPECTVTDEIREDLLKLGWIVVTEDEQDI